MAKACRLATIAVDYQTLAMALIQYHRLYEGLWEIYVDFDIRAANYPVPDVQGIPVLRPCAIVPVTMIGLQQVETVGPLTVEAARVNPVPHSPKQDVDSPHKPTLRKRRIRK